MIKTAHTVQKVSKSTMLLDLNDQLFGKDPDTHFRKNYHFYPVWEL